jgi:enoyl-CoA hydratase
MSTASPLETAGVEVPAYEHLLVRTHGRVGVVQLNRPRVLNALSPEVMLEVATALEAFDADPEIGAMVLTGSERAFAAGADIKAMSETTVSMMLRRDFLKVWDRIAAIRKPLIAAVSGFALGGGCELMLMCDMVVASETARIGQPEITLGVIPGAGGTQRLARVLGKVRTMELVLLGGQISAGQALDWGLVNRVVPVELYLDEALKLAGQLAALPPLALQLAKQSVLKAHETFLREGLALERQNFSLLFGTDDQKEGMRAFLEKRAPEWKGT